MIVLRPNGYFTGSTSTLLNRFCALLHCVQQQHIVQYNLCRLVWPRVAHATGGWSSSLISRVIHSSINQSKIWKSSTQILQHVPFLNSLSWLREHFIPVFCFHGRALAAKQELSHEFVDTDEVVVHHGNKQTRATDVFEGNAKSEIRIKNWTQRLLVYYCFLLLNSLSVA